MIPDPWQVEFLRSTSREILGLASRQVGKSQVAAALALKSALLEAPALVLIVSPSERQSGELIQKTKDLYETLAHAKRAKGSDGASLLPVRTAVETSAKLDTAWLEMPPKVRESALQLHLANGSRIIGLPENERTIRGYSGASLLIVDEASRVKDALYYSVRAMLATSRGRLIALSTPFGQRGWFFDEWLKADKQELMGLKPRWHRFKVKATECQRIPKDFLRDEELSLGPRWFRQEYEASFEEAIDAVFSYEAVMRATSSDLEPLILE